ILLGVAAGASYRLFARGPAADAVVIALLWMSHWPADVLTGIKPTWPGGPEVGLDLYTYTAFDVVLESGLVAVCSVPYLRSLPPAVRRTAGAVMVPVGLIALQCGFAALELSRERPLPHRFDVPHLLP